MTELVLVLSSIGTIITAVIVLWDKIKPLLFKFTKLQIFTVNSEDELRQLKISPVLQKNKWTVGRHQGKPAIWLDSYFVVSNLSETFNNAVTSVRIKKYKTHGELIMQIGKYGAWRESEHIPPNTSCDLWVTFFLNNKVVKKGKSINLEFIFFDKYYNSYKVRDILFEYIQRKDINSEEEEK